MKYLSDMQNKYGFGDGGTTPPDAWALRTLYVAAINAFAEKLASGVRAVCFDRPGMHNGCMILFVKARPGITPDHQATKEDFASVCEPDEAFYQAISQAEEFDPDGYIEVKISAHKTAFDAALTTAVQECAVPLY